MGQWIFGCDICQEVCPHNQQTQKTRCAQVHSAYESKTSSLDLLEVLNWNEEDRRNAFKGSAMKRAKLDMMQRNAAIAAKNYLAHSDDPVLQEKITSWKS